MNRNDLVYTPPKPRYPADFKVKAGARIKIYTRYEFSPNEYHGTAIVLSHHTALHPVGGKHYTIYLVQFLWGRYQGIQRWVSNYSYRLVGA